MRKLEPAVHSDLAWPADLCAEDDDPAGLDPQQQLHDVRVAGPEVARVEAARHHRSGHRVQHQQVEAALLGVGVVLVVHLVGVVEVSSDSWWTRND